MRPLCRPIAAFLTRADRRRRGWLAILAAAGWLAASLQAAPPDDPRWYEAIGARAFQANYDPTLIGRRLLVESSFEDDRNGQTTTKLRNEARYSVLVAPALAAGLQVVLPLECVTAGGTAVAGTGDPELRAGVVGRLAANLRAGAGLNLKFPSASSPLLADAFEIRPIAALSWDAADGRNLGLYADWKITPDNTGASGENELELKLPVGQRFNDRWSATASPKVQLEFNTRTALPKIEAGPTLLLGRDRQFAISPAIEAPLSVQNLQWKALLTAGWYF